MAYKKGTANRCSFLLALVLALFSFPKVSSGYSLLTHEQIVDIVWKDHIEPLLRSRFPEATLEQLRTAHAFAYGGCLIQDIGYYPFGNKFFSDLTHYVRSGDFIISLIRESTDPNEYAFALGALAHYSSDITAHPTINQCVALSFPCLRAKYGDSITYAQNPKAHIRVEFGFDVVQVAKNRYTSENYRNFIGFEVSKPVLERAVLKTYGLQLDETLGPVDLAIGTFRRAASQIVPRMTRVALITHKAEIVRDVPNFDKKRFLYNLSRSEYEKEWGKEYHRPGLGARVLAICLRLLPKIGPLRSLDFKIPNAETERLYLASVNKTADNYRILLRNVGLGHLDLPNLDCDTGFKASSGEYVLSDKTYVRLLDELSKHGLKEVRPDLRENILAFFHDRPPSKRTRKERKAWSKTLQQLRELEQQERGASSQGP